MSTGNRKQPEPEYDMRYVGYARVSTEEQNLDMQIQALMRAGVHPDHIHTEQVSGVAAKRYGRDLALKDCRPGSVFVVWKLDRLGRSLLDLYEFVMKLEKAQVGFRSLTESIDTTTPIGRFSLAMLAAAAQFERDQIVERTRTGVKRAQERGVKFGQPTKLTPAVCAEIESRVYAGERVDDIAKSLRMAPATIRKKYDGKLLDDIRVKGPLAGRKQG